MLPTDSAYAPLYFTAHGQELAIALLSANHAIQVDVVYAILLKKTSPTVWVELERREPMWADIKETVNEGQMAQGITAQFNITIATLSGAPSVTYEQNLSVELAKYTIVNNQLVKLLG